MPDRLHLWNYQFSGMLTQYRQLNWLTHNAWSNKQTNSMAPESKHSSPCSWQLPLVPNMSQVNPLHTPQPSSSTSILIPSPNYASVFRVASFLQDFPPKPCMFLSSPLHTTCPAYLILLDLICLMISGDKYKLWNSWLCNFHHSTITSSLLSPNIFLGILFSNTLSLCSSLKVRHQVSHPYRTDTVMVL
jgi:hypothetical protein